MVRKSCVHGLDCDRGNAGRECSRMSRLRAVLPSKWEALSLRRRSAVTIGSELSPDGRAFTFSVFHDNILKQIIKNVNAMLRQPAMVLGDDDVRRLLRAITQTRHPVRNRVIVLLSFHAGLRACEIAGLTWPMVLGPSGKFSGALSLCGGITKGGKSRVVPISPVLMSALKDLHHALGRPQTGPVVHSERGGAMTPRSVVNWFRQTYDGLGMAGCSSHSGRRTFITKAARLLPKINGSLRDVQELAGHAALSTTERYIQGDRAIQRKLVTLI